MHLFGALIARSQTDPDGVFCHFFTEGRHVVHTNASITSRARSIAALLLANGVGRGEVIPIVMEHRIELQAAFIGCSLAGATPTLLSPPSRKQDPVRFRRDIAALLTRIDAPCVLASAATIGSLPDGRHVLIDLDSGYGHEAGTTTVELLGAGSAFLQHSSGTTGLKKGVCITHAAALEQIRRYSAAIGMGADDCVVSWLPLYHDMGLITAFLMPAVLGTPVICLDALEWVVRPTMLLDQMAAFGGTMCWLPNFAFQHITRMAQADQAWDLSSLRMIVNCSEPCRPRAHDAFTRRFAVKEEILQTSYAMAENVFAVTQTRPGSPVRRSPVRAWPDVLSSGLPIDGVSVEIVDAQGNQLASRELGEIRIQSACLFDGYYRQPELTAARLRAGSYATGDLGFLDEGELFVVSRTDDVLNVNGRKIVAHEIESGLNEIPGIAPGRVLVHAEYDESEGTNRLVVAAERLSAPASSGPGSLGATPSEAAIMTSIRRRVFEQCGIRPERVTLLERGFLVKSTSGKLSRSASIEKVLLHR